MEIKNQKIVDFLADLASKKPAPGGGSASAMAGAMAAGLVIMVCELTKKKEFKKIRRQVRIKLTKLTKLIQEDAEAYLQVIRFKGSQGTVKKAAEVPLETARQSLEVLKMANYVSEYGNQNARSDAFCAIELAAAAIYGALENVRANLPFIKNKKLAQYFRSEIEKILKSDKLKQN